MAANDESSVSTAPSQGRGTNRSQEYYDQIKAKFADERNLRLSYRPPGTDQYIYDLDGQLF